MEIMFVYCFTDTRPDACSPAVIWFYVSVHLTDLVFGVACLFSDPHYLLTTSMMLMGFYILTKRDNITGFVDIHVATQ